MQFIGIDRCKVLISYADVQEQDINKFVILSDMEVSNDYLKLKELINGDNLQSLRDCKLPHAIDKALIQAYSILGISSTNLGDTLEIKNLVLEDMIVKRDRDGLFVNEYVYKINGE